MKTSSDIFGKMLLETFQGKDVYEIVERDDGYISSAPMRARYFSDYRNWPELERKCVKYVSGKVLDIGCGAGRHALYLQQKGLDVTGIDVSPLAIKVSKARGIKNAHVLSIDKIASLRKHSFDTAIMFGNNFGLFRSVANCKKLLAQFEKILSPSGKIIAITNDPRGTQKPEHRAYHKMNKRRRRLPGQISIRLRYQKEASPWFDFLFVSEEELKEILKDTNWEIAKIIRTDSSAYGTILERRKNTNRAN